MNPVPPPPPGAVHVPFEPVAPVPPERRYGVAILGPKYPYFYENEDGTISEIVLRGRLSLSFDEHLAHVRDRALIASMAGQAQRELNRGYDKVVRTSDAEAQEAGMSRDELILQRMNELVTKVSESQVAQWERTKTQVLRLVVPGQHEQFVPVLENADPAHINELLRDMEADIIERQKRETSAAASVDPTSPPPPSGS